jgi:hypothetical protein
MMLCLKWFFVIGHFIPLILFKITIQMLYFYKRNHLINRI